MPNAQPSPTSQLIPPHRPGGSQAYLQRLALLLGSLDHKEIDRGVDLVTKAWLQGRQIILFGNGGSGLTALHMATDWSKGIFSATGRRFRGRSLLDNIGILMAYGNDNCFKEIFTDQLKHVMDPGDLVIAISGSGNSPNVISAIDYANDHGAVTLGLCGYSGGKLKTSARHCVWVDVHDMQLCEDVHSIFGHIVMQKLCQMVKVEEPNE